MNLENLKKAFEYNAETGIIIKKKPIALLVFQKVQIDMVK